MTMLVVTALATAVHSGSVPGRQETNCFGFPDRRFSPHNRVHICDPEPNGCGDDGLTVKTGMTAPSFTLSDRSGKPFSLNDLIADKPVFIEFGSFTYGNATNALAEKYGDALNWILVNTVEAHPKKPDPSPYAGVNWMFKYSNFSQPRNYSSRVEVSRHVADVFGLSKRFTILVDDLTPHNATGNDPLWCDWGPAPNSAWLIGKNKTVVLAQTWFHIGAMDKAIAKLLGQQENYAPPLQEPLEVRRAKAMWTNAMAAS